MRTGAWMCTLILLLAGCGEEVTVQLEGAGRVTSSPPGIDCGVACRTKVDTGSELRLTVEPAPGSIFAGWGGACSGQKETCTIKVDAPASVTVKLSKLHRVEIQKAGDGMGTITSSPPGIDCGEKCKAEFADQTRLTLDVKPEIGVKIVEVGPCGDASSCKMTVRSPLNVRVELDVVPGALISSTRIDEEGNGRFALDPSGNAVWAKEQRLETYAPDGERIRRSSLADSRILTPRALAARADGSIIVAGDASETSAVASIRPTGETAWSIEVPGRVLGAGAWAKGAVVALAIDEKVQIGDRSYGSRNKDDVVMVWLDDAGKVSDSAALGLPIKGDSAAFTVDVRGAGIIAVKAGKQHVLAKASGSEGQSWNVKLGEIERAFLTTNEAGDVWAAGTALSLESEILETGGKATSEKPPCGDTGFGFVARFDAAGALQSSRAMERGIAGFGLDPSGAPVVAIEFVGNVSTSTGTFTSAGFAAKTADCDQVCEKDCAADSTKEPCVRCKAGCAAERAASRSEALCGTAPDILIGALTPSFDLAWARQLSVEDELSIEGFGLSEDGLAFVAVMSAGRFEVLGGENETTIPSGVSLLVFR